MYTSFHYYVHWFSLLGIRHKSYHYKLSLLCAPCFIIRHQFSSLGIYDYHYYVHRCTSRDNHVTFYIAEKRWEFHLLRTKMADEISEYRVAMISRLRELVNLGQQWEREDMLEEVEETQRHIMTLDSVTRVPVEVFKLLSSAQRELEDVQN